MVNVKAIWYLWRRSLLLKAFSAVSVLLPLLLFVLLAFVVKFEVYNTSDKRGLWFALMHGYFMASLFLFQLVVLAFPHLLEYLERQQNGYRRYALLPTSFVQLFWARLLATFIFTVLYYTAVVVFWVVLSLYWQYPSEWLVRFLPELFVLMCFAQLAYVALVVLLSFFIKKLPWALVQLLVGALSITLKSFFWLPGYAYYALQGYIYYKKSILGNEEWYWPFAFVSLLIVFILTIVLWKTSRMMLSRYLA
jgi:hypothetical protein